MWKIWCAWIVFLQVIWDKYHVISLNFEHSTSFLCKWVTVLTCFSISRIWVLFLLTCYLLVSCEQHGVSTNLRRYELGVFYSHLWTSVALWSSIPLIGADWELVISPQSFITPVLCSIRTMQCFMLYLVVVCCCGVVFGLILFISRCIWRLSTRFL